MELTKHAKEAKQTKKVILMPVFHASYIYKPNTDIH